MPGIVMDGVMVNGIASDTTAQNGVGKSAHEGASSANGKTGAPYANGSLDRSYENGGMFSSADERRATESALASTLDQLPPELIHITEGFFPFAQLINRSVQQCWNDLSDLITELAEIQVPPQHAQSQPPSHLVLPGSKGSGNQSNENIHKKIRILDFAQAKRAEFIKLLVLSQWGRQAADVSKLIDLQNFLRSRFDAYNAAVQGMGYMKNDLVRAQMANPDLKTALEVLSKGRVSSMPDLGYVPPKPLTAKKMLKSLQKINRIISSRLVLQDQVPSGFSDYCVHDGRVTFTVPREFELDLSIAEEKRDSQFFFIDIRFLFTPSSPIPKGRLFSDLDSRINFVLMNEGLTGCFKFLHNFILTNKINVLFKQAIALARGYWSETLRVELVHRTLVVQYWANKSGAKSWLEIGVKSGRRKDASQEPRLFGVPFLGLRWFRENKEVDSTEIAFDTAALSMETILRSAVALHMSYVLSATYDKLSQGALYARSILSIGVQTSTTEPSDCILDVQLTKSRSLRVTVEPVSGLLSLQPTPLLLSRHDVDRNSDKTAIDDIFTRISRLRCVAAMEEVESRARFLGWETVNPRSLRIEDMRRIFPPNVLRSAFFRHQAWRRGWIVAETSSIDGDNWWVIQLKSNAPPRIGAQPPQGAVSAMQSAQMVTGRLVAPPKTMDYSTFADLEHALSGMIVIQANARYVADLQTIHHSPPATQLRLEPHLRVPNLSLRFKSSTLPPALRISPAVDMKRPLIRETVHLSFKGIDRRNDVAVVIAYGRLTAPMRELGQISSKTDQSIAFRPNGDIFAMRFVSRIGEPIIAPLLSRLQRLEQMLSTLQTLKRRKLRPESISLSRLNFTYLAGADLSAGLQFTYEESSSASDLDASTLMVTKVPLARLRLSIDFSKDNPHRRIKDSLSAILNGKSPDAGLAAVTQLLPATLPLLRAFDRIVASSDPSQQASDEVRITVRSAKMYQIRYTSSRRCFLVTVAQQKNRMTWVIKDISPSRYQTDEDTLYAKLREQIYTAKGDGWKGMGGGAIADAVKVENLINALDSVMKTYVPGETADVQDEGTKPQEWAERKESPNDKKLSVVAGANKKAVGAPAKTKGQAPTPKDEDIIMID